jgi:NitT/TauT family transport system substrate-binding protein
VRSLPVTGDGLQRPAVVFLDVAPEIRSIKELKGKVLGVATLTSGESFLSRRLLKDAGIDADKEMTLRVIGNTPDRFQALRAGAVDATTLTTPVDIHAERTGLRRLAFMGDTLESINGGFGVSDRWLQQRPDQIKKMIAFFRASPLTSARNRSR